MEAYLIGVSYRNWTVRIADYTESAPVRVYDYSIDAVRRALVRPESEGKLKIDNMNKSNIEKQLKNFINLDIETKETRYTALKLLYDVNNRYKLRVISETGEIKNLTLEECEKLGGLISGFIISEAISIQDKYNCSLEWKAVKDDGTLMFIDTYVSRGYTEQLLSEDYELKSKIKMLGEKAFEVGSSTKKIVMEILDDSDSINIKSRLNIARAIDTHKTVSAEAAFDLITKIMGKALIRYKINMSDEDTVKFISKLEENYILGNQKYIEAYDGNLQETESCMKEYPNRIEIMSFAVPTKRSSMDVYEVHLMAIFKHDKLVLSACYPDVAYVGSLLDALIYKYNEHKETGKSFIDVDKIFSIARFNVNLSNDNGIVQCNDYGTLFRGLKAVEKIERSTIYLYTDNMTGNMGRSRNTEDWGDMEPSEEDDKQYYMSLLTGKVFETVKSAEALNIEGKNSYRHGISGRIDINRILDLDDLDESRMFSRDAFDVIGNKYGEHTFTEEEFHKRIDEALVNIYDNLGNREAGE